MVAENTTSEIAEDLPETAAVIDDAAAGAAALLEKFADALIPGYQAELDPEEAERAGAFHESALDAKDAMESIEDLPAALEKLAVSLG